MADGDRRSDAISKAAYRAAAISAAAFNGRICASSPYAIAGGVVVLTAIAWHTMMGEPATEMPAPD
jgi:hypothetical protein